MRASSNDNGQEPGSSYNPKRGAAVIRYASDFLDRAIPLEFGSHANVAAYSIDASSNKKRCIATMEDGSNMGFRDVDKFVGYTEAGSRHSYLFRNNELHIEVQTDPDHVVGKDAPGNVSDVVLPKIRSVCIATGWG
jgi:malate synthase